ncbi:UNKNOWN [Stylonychia lemnae]|uniref:Uncharacterized protein n=1 Tax=Stylonychia lemnae TaxID=5949 RepID=A0A078AML5_STYLE|nr:UNKNOWN [Stylonychia lemnae]|eukprot:CDW83640.1 UNKNOWN [Stylonychia lemnae]
MGGGGSKSKKSDNVVRATNTFTTATPNHQPVVSNIPQKQQLQNNQSQQILSIQSPLQDSNKMNQQPPSNNNSQSYFNPQPTGLSQNQGGSSLQNNENSYNQQLQVQQAEQQKQKQLEEEKLRQAKLAEKQRLKQQKEQERIALQQRELEQQQQQQAVFNKPPSSQQPRQGLVGAQYNAPQAQQKNEHVLIRNEQDQDQIQTFVKKNTLNTDSMINMTVNLSTVEYKQKKKNANQSYSSNFGAPGEMSNGFSNAGLSFVSGFVAQDTSYMNPQFDKGDQIDINELQNYIQSPIKKRGL